MRRSRTVVLDAMGVIFQAKDDVAELLLPFVKRYNDSIDEQDLYARYEQASLGHINVDEFWQGLGLSPSVEDEYLAGHELNKGVLEFLTFARDSGINVWCLSNDVSRWSLKLRQRFTIEGLFVDFVISGDIGFRKPSEEAYRCLIDRIGFVPHLFVDDRERNVVAARSTGIHSVIFGTGTCAHGDVVDFDSLTTFVDQSLD